jgi:flagellar hook-basal body complex protein FliE
MTIPNIRHALAAYESAARRLSPESDEAGAATGAPPLSFASLVRDSAAQAETSLTAAEGAAFASVRDNIDVTDVVSALNEAELRLKTIISVRDRLVSSLQEIFRMPI